MKSATFGFIFLCFLMSFLMWLGFANGILNGLHPMTDVTRSFDVMSIVYSTLFYFGPHLLISVVLLYRFRNEDLTFK